MISKMLNEILLKNTKKIQKLKKNSNIRSLKDIELKLVSGAMGFSRHKSHDRSEKSEKSEN